LRCVQSFQRINARDGGVMRLLLNFCEDLAGYGNRVMLLTKDERAIFLQVQLAAANWTIAKSAAILCRPSLNYHQEYAHAVDSVSQDADVLQKISPK
jgi:hypothetical protein